jgi:pyruvate/2-oxoglutarate/acetoin dehydrogenase E1 component
MGTYKEELAKAMNLLAAHPRTVFIGQNMIYGGTSMFWTLQDIPKEKKIELPVFEEVQMGMSVGMALEGLIPVSVYPRMDFLICATNQLVNHLDKVNEMSEGQFKPVVIIRTAIGSNSPLMPGPQHCQDHTEALRHLCKHINVVKLETADQIVPEYKKALESDRPTILIEIPDIYNKDLQDKLKEARKNIIT